MKYLISLALFLLSVAVSLSGQTARKPEANNGAVINKDGVGFQMVVVHGNGPQFPRLTSYQDANVMKEVNRQIDEITGEFGCRELNEGKKGGFAVKSQVEYTAKQIFSIYASEAFYCGGAYPTNDYNISLTFDLKTGKLVGFEELFRSYETDKTEILKAIFAKQIERSEKLVSSGKIKENTCDGDPDLWSLENLESSTFAFNFASQGLRVQPVWSHALEACAERVTVPYAKLGKFAAPGGILARVMQ